MNCSECIELITDLVRHDLVDTRERDNAVEHMSTCEHCAATLKRERALQEALLAVKDEDTVLGAPREIRDKLQSAFRTQEPVLVVTKPVRMRFGIAGLAAAAVLTLAVAAASYWSPTRTPPEVSRFEQPHASATPDRGVVPVSPVRDVVVPAKHRMSKKKVRTERVVASTSYQATVTSELGEFRPVRMGNEFATEFIPLRETRGLPPSESGQVIRIEMPRSALAYFGFSMASEQPGQKVKADVLMADDGLARAIRFVR